MEVSSLAQPLFLKRIMNRTQILSLLLLILITAIPQKLFAEVVTQSFDGNRLAVMPGVLLTRLVNTVAFNYSFRDYKVKHLETTPTKPFPERPRASERIKNTRKALLIAMAFGDNNSMPDYGFEISGGSEIITIDTGYPSSDVTNTRVRDVTFKNHNIHVGANLSTVGLDNLALGLLYQRNEPTQDTTMTATTDYFYNNNFTGLKGVFKTVGWNLVYNLPKDLFVYDFIYLSLGATNTTFDTNETNSQVTTYGGNTTVAGSTGSGGAKHKDYVGGTAILTEKYRAEYYHFLRYNLTPGDRAPFTEQSQSQLDKVEVEAIFGAPEFLHVLGKELYFSAFFLQNINNLLFPNELANPMIMGTVTTYNKITKNGVGLGFSPSTGMSYGLGLSQEEFEVTAFDLGDPAKALRKKEYSGLVAGLGIGYNW